jgi:tetratricopeptide (TPR) repeat protein
LCRVSLAIWEHFSSKQDAPVTGEDLDTATRKMLEAFYDAARKEGRIPEQEWKAKEDEITRLTEELRKLKQQLAARSGEPAEAELSKLLAAGDLDAAYRIKSKRAENFPRDLYELGVLCELRFDWPAALENFRKAWQLGHDPEHGYKYGHLAQKLNQFNEAVLAYEALLPICTDLASRATVLNNLAALYLDTHRMKEAERMYAEALAIFRKLTQFNPNVWLWYVAMTLNNKADVFRATNRIEQAIETCREALAIYRKLVEIDFGANIAYIAATLSNLAILYTDPLRVNLAEQAYDEALKIYRELAVDNPNDYMPNVATILNNLGLLYRAMQRMKEAEYVYDEALKIRRNFAVGNPDGFLPDVAATLNNLANLYTVTERMNSAEQAYAEALAIRRKLADANPDAYLPEVAITLNNLANLFLSMERIPEAETHAAESEGILEPLWQANPELQGDQMAKTLWTRTRICAASQKPAEAVVFAHRALAAAYDPALKQSIQQLIDRLTPASQG